MYAAENFRRGNYSKCLQQLELQTCEGSQSLVINENNRLMCRFLINQVEQLSITEVEKSFLSLFDNCILMVRHACIALEIPMTVLYNCFWMYFSCRGGEFENEEKLKKLLLKFHQLCATVSGDHFPTSINFSRLLKSCNRTKDLLLSIRNTSIGIFSELSAIVISSILPNQEVQFYINLEEFVELYLMDAREIEILSSQPTEELFKFDLASTPRLKNELQTKHAIDVFTLFHHAVSARGTFKVNSPWREIGLYIDSVRQLDNNQYETALSLALENEMENMSAQMKLRSHLILARIYSCQNDRHKSLENLKECLKIDKYSLAAHYYMGREFGKMGLSDKMLKSYQNLVKSVKNSKTKNGYKSPVEEQILKWIDQDSRISKQDALYLLAVAYGINEMFEEAAAIFENLIKPQNLRNIIADSNRKGLIEMPNSAVIFHEAACMFLLTGNLSKAQNAIEQAILGYPESKKTQRQMDVHGTRDLLWIKSLMQKELQLETDVNRSLYKYYEDYLSFFEEDIIGLLILAEIQRIQESEESRHTLNQVLILLSKYMTRVTNDGDCEKREQLALVQVLASRTCMSLAKLMSVSRSFSDVNKMYKRAVSCNQGDKDTLYNYAYYLVQANKLSEAEKLWTTFCKAEPKITLEETQSLAIRFLLRPQTSSRQISELLSKILLKTSA